MNIPMFIGVNEKFLNLAQIFLVEDVSTEAENVAKITTATGDEIELVGEDAEALFERLDLFTAASDALLDQMQKATAAMATQTGGTTL